jgi:methylthioribose-1-phosphate isomerase
VHVTPLRWEQHTLFLLDQRRLPLEEVWIACKSSAEVAEAIRSMIVRGAPAIGVCAAFGVALAGLSGEELSVAGARLKESRPTAVNLCWAVDRMLEAAAAAPAGDLATVLTAEAEEILRADVAANRQIGVHGAALLGPSSTILTHCNAGALATGGYGTALGVVRAAVESGRSVAVFADETRPYLQGARLTAWELQKDGIDVTLITDNMAGHFFQQRTFDAVIVGADRIAANGDTANKIGTYTVAVLAEAHGVPFYVAAPLSTIDRECPSGAEIPIEERSADEVTEIAGSRIAPEGIGVRHPAFDVTPARLITAIITESGVLRRPYEVSIPEAFARTTGI